jgi:hypothetical protein
MYLNGYCVSLNTDLEELFAQTNADDTTPVAKIGPYTLLKSSFYYLKNKLSDEVFTCSKITSDKFVRMALIFFTVANMKIQSRTMHNEVYFESSQRTKLHIN